MKNKAFYIEYAGTGYHGWQSQKPGIASVQTEVEKAVSVVASQAISVVCAGRTDAGVHALCQVVNCLVPDNYSKTAWTLGVNSNLPGDIRIIAQYDVNNEFHARYSAESRYYCYVIYNNRIRPGLFNDRVSWYYKRIDIEKMLLAAKKLVGRYDFTSFRSSKCQSKTAIRTIKYINIRKHDDDHIIVDIEANAFLHNMVRNIIGTLVEIATKDDLPVEYITEILDAKNRTAAGHTAPASGLYFAGVRYPKYFNLPFIANKAWFVESINELV